LHDNHKGSYRWAVLGIIMSGTFMAILDSSIVNVVLPHIMSAFGVNRQQIEWVSTSFMISMAVVMPLVAWLVHRFGHKSLYLTSLTLFTIGSALCAFAWNYNVLIISRIIQAVGGGAIQPVGMAIIADLFEPHERGKALGIWGTGVMIGPALGPTLGGYLTDWFNWRTIFSVNIPFGIITVIAGLILMRKEDRRGAAPKFDIWGFTFLSMFLICTLLALSKGQEKGWMSPYISTCWIIAVVGIVMFLAVEATVKQPILDLGLFRYRNFTISMILGVFRAVGLFTTVFLLPIFLQNYVGYSTIQTGLWMMPGAIVVGIMMPISGRLSDRFAPAGLTIIGAALTGYSMLLYGYLDPLSSAGAIIGPQIIRGIGLALMMSPLLTAAINSVPTSKVPIVSSFLNIAQSVGGSFGIAITNTIVTNSITGHAIRIGEQIGPGSLALQNLAARGGLGAGLHTYTTMQANLPATSTALILKTAMIKANVMGFQNGFVVGGLIVLACIPLCFFLEPSAHHGKKEKVMME
jgi:EmrB/QacA subfamily drug resistance transporter